MKWENRCANIYFSFAPTSLPITKSSQQRTVGALMHVGETFLQCRLLILMFAGILNVKLC